ncbi:MAG: ATP-binding protein [Acidobacteriaceae bacterium]|nr:ATP-binding protein [Acidobacteriaceae bacterium]
MAENQSSEIERVDTLLDSSLESVDAAEAAVLDVAGRMGFDEDDMHAVGMAVRESMVNAVVHGNRYNARKKVHLQVYQANDHMSIIIGDEGEGFDMSQLPDPLAEENLLRQSGRGLLLIQAFVDEFHLGKRNPSGTEVRMVKYLANKAN